MNQFNIIKIYYIFTQWQDTNSIQILIEMRHFNIPRDIKQGAKMSWSKGTEIIDVVLLSLWNYVRNKYQKIFENNPHIFKCNVAFTKSSLT